MKKKQLIQFKIDKQLLKQARKEKGLTLEAVGDMIGKDKRTVWAYEKLPTIDAHTLIALAKIYEKPAEYFAVPV